MLENKDGESVANGSLAVDNQPAESEEPKTNEEKKNDWCILYIKYVCM